MVSRSSQPAARAAVDATATATPHRHVVLVARLQFGVAVVLEIETGGRGTCPAETPSFSHGVELFFQKLQFLNGRGRRV